MLPESFLPRSSKLRTNITGGFRRGEERGAVEKEKCHAKWPLSSLLPFSATARFGSPKLVTEQLGSLAELGGTRPANCISPEQ